MEDSEEEEGANQTAHSQTTQQTALVFSALFEVFSALSYLLSTYNR